MDLRNGGGLKMVCCTETDPQAQFVTRFSNCRSSPVNALAHLGKIEVMLDALQNTSCCIYLPCGSAPDLIHLICSYRAFMHPISNGPKVPDLVLCCLLLKHSLLQGCLHKNVGANSLFSSVPRISTAQTAGLAALETPP